MPVQDVLLKGVDIPEGYEPTGEYFSPRPGIIYLCDGRAAICPKSVYCSTPSVILRRVEPDAVKLARWVKGFTGHTTIDPQKSAFGLADSILAEWEKSQ